MTTKATAEQVSIAVVAWYYVEWSPLGAIRAVTVEDAHFRNYCAFKRREAVGYEPVGLFPSLDSALDHIREMKRMKKELWHDETGVRGGDEGSGAGVESDGTEYSGLRTEGSGYVGPGGDGEGEAERTDRGDEVADQDADDGVNNV